MLISSPCLVISEYYCSDFCATCVYTVPPKVNVTASTSSDAEVVVGRSTVLQCSVFGVPSPAMQWLVNGRPVDGSRLRVMAGGRQLEIINSELTDSGRYTCIAKNDAGMVERDFDLRVLGQLLYNSAITLSIS